MSQDQKKRGPSFEKPAQIFKPESGPSAQDMLDEIDQLLAPKEEEDCGCGNSLLDLLRGSGAELPWKLGHT